MITNIIQERKINNYLIADAIKEIPKGRDSEESLPDSV